MSTRPPRDRNASLLRLPACMLAAALLIGCSSESKDRETRARSPETQARVTALVDKTLAQMVFVEGGGFWLGDFGLLMFGTLPRCMAATLGRIT